MILKNETFEKFGYTVESLSEKSSKKIVCKCDYCEQQYISCKKRIFSSREIVKKDSCKECKFKKREEVSLKRDGVKNSSQRPDVKQKIKNTHIDKYGSYFCETDEFKKQAKKTNLKKYDVEHILQSNDFKERIKKTNLKRYGSENASSSSAIKNKRKITCLKKFGNEYFTGSDIGKAKLKAGLLDKYGVENAFQSEEVKDKIKSSNIEKYGVDHHMKIENIAKNAAKKTVISKIKNGTIKTHNGKTQSELAKKSGYSRSRFNTLVKKYGFEKAVNMNPKQSYLEKIFADILDTNNITYTKQFKVGNKYADFLVGDILVELDGLYWHSDRILADDYHIKKKAEYIEAGYDSLFLREDEINNKPDTSFSLLKNKLGMNDKIYARKCVLELCNDDAKLFLNNNHLMGYGSGKSVCLKYDGEIVCIMQYRKIKDRDFDISRFCSKIGYTIIGGFSRLLKYIERTENPNLIRCFIDQRYGSGIHLNNLGFKRISCYKSFKWTDTKQTFHRLKYPSNSGYDYGLYKIWDCGQINYTKVYNV